MGDGPSGRSIGRGGVLAVVAVAALAMAASAQARTVVDTTGAWNGMERVCPFGNPDTATYGQVVTVPALDTVLDRFTVYIAELNSGPTLVFRGEVYAWDGTKAVGPSLWEGAPRSLMVNDNPQELTFETGGVQLLPGRQYVLFASVSKDYDANAFGRLGCWGFISGRDAYPGGSFVFQNNADDESLWTTRPWESIDAVADLAFKASFGTPMPESKQQCQNGGWRRYGVFKNQGDCVSFVATGGRNQPATTRDTSPSS